MLIRDAPSGMMLSNSEFEFPQDSPNPAFTATIAMALAFNR